MNGPPGDLLTLAELARRADFELGEVRVSPATRVLRGPSGEVSLEPRAMQVLVVLSEFPGSVVTRDELFRRCWGAALVGDDSLNRAVADVRRAARTVAGEAFQIETVPRTGYRLVAQPADEEVVRRGGSDAPPVQVHRVRRWVVAGGAAAAAAGGAWLLLRDPRRARAAALVEASARHLRMGSPEGDGMAAQLLEHAVALNPGDASAWGKLALVRCYLAETAAPNETAARVDAVQRAASQALRLDPRQPDGLAALALLPPYYGDWSAAETRMDRVLAVAPDHLPTRDARAFLYVSVGRIRENYAERVAIAPREPLDATLLYRMIYAHWMIGQTEAADRAAERAMQLWPKHPAIWFARLWTLAFTGRPERALALVHEPATRPELPSWMLETLSVAIAAMHSRRPADVALAAGKLVDDLARGPSLSINALLLLNGLGEIDRAFDVVAAYLLEEGPLMAAVHWRPGQVTIDDQRRRKTHMLFVPVTAPMRADPRFPGLVERVGLADYWRKSRITPDHLQAG